MGDRGLREALEELVRLTASGYVINPYELRELLAAHPVEPAHLPNRHGETVEIDLDQLEPNEPAPAKDRQPSDAAVAEAAERLWLFRTPIAKTRESCTEQARAALEAAYRVDVPRPALDREALLSMLSTTVFHCFDHEEFGLSAKHATAVVDAVMELALRGAE